jgi:hypothetical protein
VPPSLSCRSPRSAGPSLRPPHAAPGTTSSPPFRFRSFGPILIVPILAPFSAPGADCIASVHLLGERAPAEFGQFDAAFATFARALCGCAGPHVMPPPISPCIARRRVASSAGFAEHTELTCTHLRTPAHCCAHLHTLHTSVLVHTIWGSADAEAVPPRLPQTTALPYRDITGILLRLRGSPQGIAVLDEARGAYPPPADAAVETITINHFEDRPAAPRYDQFGQFDPFASTRRSPRAYPCWTRRAERTRWPPP